MATLEEDIFPGAAEHIVQNRSGQRLAFQGSDMTPFLREVACSVSRIWMMLPAPCAGALPFGLGGSAPLYCCCSLCMLARAGALLVVVVK